MAEETEQSGKIYEYTTREMSELRFALFYALNCRHGTSGHNQLMLLAKMAEMNGFRLGSDNKTIFWLGWQDRQIHAIPGDVVAVDDGSGDPDSWQTAY